MKESFKFILTGTLPDLNAELNAAKTHWSIYSRHKKKWTNDVAWQVKAQIRNIIDKPIKLSIKYYLNNQKKDPDNIVFAKKYILDGMVNSGILPNDTLQWIKGFSEDFELDRSNPRIEVTIKPITLD